MSLLILLLEAVCVGVGLFYAARFKQTALKLTVAYFCVVFCIDAVLTFRPDLSGLWTRRQYILMLPIEFSVYVALLKPVPLRLFKWAAGGLFAYSFYQLAANTSANDSATRVYQLMCLLMLVVVLIYFRALLLSQEVVILRRDPLFWIATSLLLFYAGNVIITGFYFLLESRLGERAHKLFYINYALTIIRQLAFIVAFVMAGRYTDGK